MQGQEIIKKSLENIPDSPGVYQMINSREEVIYVGKAKSLNKRVRNYTSYDHPVRILRMIHQVIRVEINITSTEAEALLLESTLIKKLKPKFNILLRDDKSFPYIKIQNTHPYPQITKYRGKKLEGGDFFGPFASVKDVDRTIGFLLKLFKLRSCSDSYFANRTRPCLQYQIHRCSAPCVGKISYDEYSKLIRQVKDFLNGKTAKLQKELQAQMLSYSENMEFENAAIIRDRIKSLSYIQSKQALTDINVKDADVIVALNTESYCCVQVYLYRGGQSYGGKAFFPSHAAGSSEKEILSSFLGQFYQTRIPPKLILTNHEIEENKALSEAISKLHNIKPKIVCPKDNKRLRLINHAIENATQSIKQKQASIVASKDVLSRIQQLFELPNLPERIEVYDNSHIMGSHAVGAMIVATPEGFDKSSYRKYNFKTSVSSDKYGGGDDYSMLREVLTRRLGRMEKEPENIPDLMLIDGGKGHLTIAKEVLDEGAELHGFKFACIAKGEKRHAGGETFYMPSCSSFTLDNDDSAMRYLQVLRDEVHNFAIRSHRSKRSKALRASHIDSLPGVGKKRKQALLHYFGSYEEIEKAGLEELCKIEGISKSIANNIYDALHTKN